MTRVLFACVHNAGRSQMAAAFFNAAADPAKAHAISAGTQPAARVNPVVVEAMRETGIDVSQAVPQKLTPELARDDWPLDDPAGQPLAGVRRIRDAVRARVHSFVTGHGLARTV